MKCNGCLKMAEELNIPEEEAHEIMLNSKILGDKEILRYHIQSDLTKHALKFETVYTKILAHRKDCVYYALL